jgi:mannonate dehydratase
MQRRGFGKVLVGSAIGAAAFSVVNDRKVQAERSTKPQKKATMFVASDDMVRDLFTKKHMEYLKRHNVNHIEIEEYVQSEAGDWDLDDLKKKRDFADKHGIIISSLNFSKIRDKIKTKTRKEINHIMLGTDGERDRQIEIIARNIEKAAAIGVPVMRYHWRMEPDALGTGYKKDKNGSKSRAWKLPKNWRELPITLAGRVTLDEFFERMKYFLDRIMPVAEAHGVKIACHPPDPPMPPGYRGVDTWSYDIFNGLKTYNSLTNSPNFGFLMCIGTIGTGLKDPGGDELIDILRYFGERKKIFCVHLRNIKGSRDNFSECYPDRGDMDFYRVIKTLHDVKYSYAIHPDHMPKHRDDKGSKEAFAFAFGYIQAMIQAVNS